MDLRRRAVPAALQLFNHSNGSQCRQVDKTFAWGDLLRNFQPDPLPRRNHDSLFFRPCIGCKRHSCRNAQIPSHHRVRFDG
nr:hypothetical protein SHINE37_120345 [Rhizobiaceae bacterium]